MYGLADASRSWYLKLKTELEHLGAKPVKLDQGVFVWFDGSNLIGIMVCVVDDVIWSGTEEFVSVVAKLNSIFQIGSKHNKSFKYIGIHLQKLNDGSIEINQDEYVDELEIIDLPKERSNISQQEPISESERTEIRKAIGKLNWLAGMTRPEISFTVSDVSSRITSATIADIKLVNKTIKFLKTTRSYIKIPRIEWCDLKLLVFADASFNNLGNGLSQGGHTVLIADSKGNCSPISWCSNRLRRVVRSTLAAETLSFPDGADSAFYTSRMMKDFFPDATEPPIMCYTDSRSLFESAGSSNNVSDKRLRVEIGAIRELIQREEISMKWIEGKQQLADVFTKKGASPLPLTGVLQSGSYP